MRHFLLPPPPSTNWYQRSSRKFHLNRRSSSSKGRMIEASSDRGGPIITTSPPMPCCFSASLNDNQGHEMSSSSTTTTGYEETYTAWKVRKVWEKKPFSTARKIVDTVIQGNGDTGRNNNNLNDTSCLLIAINAQHDTSTDINTTGYEDIFEPLYGRPSNQYHYPSLTKSTSTRHDDGGNNDVVVYASTADDENNNNNNRTISSMTTMMKSSKVNHFCLTIAYRGDDFCGWQTQPSNVEQPSIQQTLEDWLTLLNLEQPEEGCDDDNNNINITVAVGSGDVRKNKKIGSQRCVQPQRADLRVSGRTDAGVHAIGQISRFRSRRMGLTRNIIQQHLLNLPQPNEMHQSIRVIHVTQVSKSFHPTFTTTCRAYIYVVDVVAFSSSDCDDVWNGRDRSSTTMMLEKRVSYLNAILQYLEGKELDFIGISYGPTKTQTTNCTLHHARARLVQFVAPVSSSDNDSSYNVIDNNDNNNSSSKNEEETQQIAICIELVGDRFLRRMVRLLVASAIRIVVDKFTNTADVADNNNNMMDDDQQWSSSSPPTTNTGLSEMGNDDDKDDNEIDDYDTDALLYKQILLQDRRLVGVPAAPSDGLIFVGARLQQ
jgi:tRNA pseudouridine(38-40) synthase